MAIKNFGFSIPLGWSEQFIKLNFEDRYLSQHIYTVYV